MRAPGILNGVGRDKQSHRHKLSLPTPVDKIVHTKDLQGNFMEVAISRVGFSDFLRKKTQVGMTRDQGSIENHHKTLHSRAKHYFGVVWTHLGLFRAVESRFSCFFGIFQGFGEPRPAEVSSS